MSSAILSAFSSRRALNRRSTAIRSAGGVSRHMPSSKDSRAAATARSMSCGCAWAARAITDRSCGETMSSNCGSRPDNGPPPAARHPYDAVSRSHRHVTDVPGFATDESEWRQPGPDTR
ncbi:hypothetical protein GCM10018783_02900 [Streptomyces griseosporeus]|nr:hypothetical protein GCM10018783_02900 [Streptomyces griseosporeus]